MKEIWNCVDEIKKRVGMYRWNFNKVVNLFSEIKIIQNERATQNEK